MTESQMCPGCKTFKGNAVGESAIYGSHDISDLCEDCWLYEDNMIEEEGANSPERIDEIIKRYRNNMRSPDFY